MRLSLLSRPWSRHITIAQTYEKLGANTVWFESDPLSLAALSPVGRTLPLTNPE